MSRGRLAGAGLLAAIYSLPLFWPPGPVLPLATPDDGPFARLFPGVPALWIVTRLAALLGAAIILSGNSPSATDSPPDAYPSVVLRRGPRQWLALVAALLLVGVSPFAGSFGPGEQVLYLVALFVPAGLLAAPGGGERVGAGRASWHVLLPIAVVGLWVAIRLATDLATPRTADMVDAWRGFIAMLRAQAVSANLLTDPMDPELPGLGAISFAFLGVPLFQADVLPLTVRNAQIFQILWVALNALGVARLARLLVGPGTAAVAVSVFLFAPYTRFVTLFPSPFLAGPLYATGLTLALLGTVRRRSEASLAALGALAGISVTFPGLVPAAALVVAAALWSLRRDWRTRWVGCVAGLATFAAVVGPALPRVLTIHRMTQHFRSHGAATLLESALLGQAPIGTFALARETVVIRPLEIVASALVEPFVNPRTAIRLWGDAIFDPLGAVLIAIGLAACVRRARRSPDARFLLLFFGAVLAPAFASPVDRVDITHAAAISVPAALLAAAGAHAVWQTSAAASRYAGALASAAAATIVALGATVLFDVVNPRLLAASSVGIMFRVLDARAAARVVVLDYPPGAGIDVRWLFTGVRTAHAGRHPVGFLPYEGGELPAVDLAAEGKDLLFWSPGLQTDVDVIGAVCRQWPAAELFELWDAAGLGRTYAARVGGPPWTPTAPPGRWQQRACASASVRPTRPGGFHASS